MTVRSAFPFRSEGYSSLVALSEILVVAVSEAMAMIQEVPTPERSSTKCIASVARFLRTRLDANWLRSKGWNDHLIRGLATKWGKDGVDLSDRRLHELSRPRLVDLILMHCRESEEQERSIASVQKGRSIKHRLLTSPAQIAIEALTVPEEPHTQAYALIGVRAVLCRVFKVWPSTSDRATAVPAGYTLLTEARLISEFQAIRTFLEHRDNRSTDNPVKLFIAHFLAARGILRLHLPKDEVVDYLSISASSELASNKRRTKDAAIGQIQFRLSDRYPRLPEVASFINEILGVPLPLRGAETVFFNGIKFSSDHSLVASVSGSPGSGKTTFALTLAAALAPLDTQTVYLSFDEKIDDLRTKLANLNHGRLRRLSFSRSNGEDNEWFIPLHLRPYAMGDFETDILAGLTARANEIKLSPVDEDPILYPPSPLMVVIDSLSTLSINTGGRSIAQPDDLSAESRDYSASAEGKRLALEAHRLCGEMPISWRTNIASFERR